VEILVLLELLKLRRGLLKMAEIVLAKLVELEGIGVAAWSGNSFFPFDALNAIMI
jgi:hypothetical protein